MNPHLKIENHETKTLLYDDDMTATLANISSVEILIQILNDFEKWSGLKMNLSKTKAIWIGANKNSLEKPQGFEWRTGVKTLGIYFSCNQEQVIKQNFYEKLSDIQKSIKSMEFEKLTLFGKVTIIKSFLIPKLLYASSILETPQDKLILFERMINKFLWQGPVKVTRVSVINSLTNGGLNLTDLETHIKALGYLGIHAFRDEREVPWESYFRFHLKSYGGFFILKRNYDVKYLNLRLSGFYSQLTYLVG